MRKFLCFLTAVFLIVSALAACETAEPTASSDPLPTAAEGVSPIRTGEVRQSLFPNPGAFECTDDGFYSLVEFEDGSTFLFYCDHDSDTLVKLCSRPDCPHDTADCDAYLKGCKNVSYYNGHLYSTFYTFGASFHIVCLDPDGRNRRIVLDTADSISGYDGSYEESIANGVVLLGFTKMGASGVVGGTQYYYKLNGSMKQPEEAPQRAFRCSEGDKLFFTASDFEGDPPRLVTWAPGGEEEYLTTIAIDDAHYCDDHCYRLIDNKFYRIDYGTLKQTLLFDTGLEGEHILRCFPDCIVIMEGSSVYDPESASLPQTLHFYSWEFEPLGEITVDYKKTIDRTMIICGETENRILLCSDISALPRYYIDKSEFGTGHITLHEFKLPSNLPRTIGQPE